jgi:hypothetical protein
MQTDSDAGKAAARGVDDFPVASVYNCGTCAAV